MAITFSTSPGVGTATGAVIGASSSARRTRVTWYGSSNCSTVTSLYGTRTPSRCSACTAAPWIVPPSALIGASMCLTATPEAAFGLST